MFLIVRHPMCLSVSFICIIQILYIAGARAQDFSGIDLKRPVRLSGGINATQTLYSSWGIAARRDPYYWMLNANVNLEILGIYIPFSATVSQQNRNFTQPFNLYGISPRYRSVTAHLGYRTMQFSSFTLSGNIFLGAGVEIFPSKSIFRFSTMYGRFSKAISVQETEGQVSGQPAYERWGYGSKLSFGSLSHNAELIIFHAADKVTSIPETVADSFHIKPAENLVIGINSRQAISKKISSDMEYALSLYTENIRIEKSEPEKYKFSTHLSPVYKTNISSQFNKAILVNLNYTDKFFQFRISYRRIDPEYKTMGSVFLNNDLEDVTGNLAWRMLKSKLNMALGAGVQRNNLDQSLGSRMNRFIGSFNCSWMMSKKVNVNLSYSNFTSTTKINNNRTSANQLGLIQNQDSLAYNQITDNTNAGINYNTGTQTVKHIMFLTGSLQKANDNHGNQSSYYNVSSGYQYGLVPLGLNISFSANINNSVIREVNTKSVGPNLTISKQLFSKAVRSTFGITYLKTFLNEISSGTNSLIRFSNSYKKGKHHTISLDLTYMTRTVKMIMLNRFEEFRGSLIYGFTF